MIRRSSITSCYVDDAQSLIFDSSLRDLRDRHVRTRNGLSNGSFDRDGAAGSAAGAPANRGRLPVLVVDDWREVNRTRLEAERLRFEREGEAFPWDWKRLLMAHWAEKVLAFTEVGREVGKVVGKESESVDGRMGMSGPPRPPRPSPPTLTSTSFEPCVPGQHRRQR